MRELASQGGIVLNRPLLIIWGALAFAQVIYIALPVPGGDGTPAGPASMPLVLGVVAVAQAVAIALLLKLRAFDPIQSGRIDPTAPEGAAALFVVLIVAWALAEAVGIYGLVIRFLHFDARIGWALAGLGAGLLFMGRPWQPKLQRPSSSIDLAQTGTPIE